MALLKRCSLLSKRLIFNPHRNYGYIVLVPEIGEDLPDNKNPLVQPDGLPQFNNVTIETCMAAIGRQTHEFEADVKRMDSEIAKKGDLNLIQDVINPMEILTTALDMTWGVSKTLYLGNSSLMPTKSYLAIHERAKRCRASKFNAPNIYQAAVASLQDDSLTDEETRVVQKFILEGKLNGLLLDENSRAKLTEVLNKLLSEKRQYKMKFDAVSNRFSQKINDPHVMSSFPRELAESMSVTPNGEGPWTATLQPHIYHPFMEYCPDRELRWNTWKAHVFRGSGYDEKEYETSSCLQEIRHLRRIQAKLLGYKNYAEMSMETKMAGSIDNVKQVLGTLLRYAKPAQDEELEKLYGFAKDSMFHGKRIELWDYEYWKRKQCKSLFNFDEQLFQEYFPLDKALSGLFALCETLYNVQMKQRQNVPVWHKDVRYFDVFEAHSAEPIAGFYFDPYARSDDKSHIRQNSGWMVGIQNHSRIADARPLAALIFNFRTPTDNVPTLLAPKDLQILFHRFGQMLQHLLSRTTYSEVSGLSNIEWDAVEVSGHVMAMWLQNKEMIDSISGHYETQAKLPDEMFDAFTNAHRHCAGTDLCKELYLSSLDLEFHIVNDYWLNVVKSLWPQYRSFPLDKLDSHPCNFSQILYEEWGAAYYSQVWSRLIAADVYAAFHEEGGHEQQVLDVGKRFRETFLALGGGMHARQVFRNFRGRDPSHKPFIAYLGLN